MRVALKFCGGCDPSFERVEYGRAIAAAAKERIEWTRLGEGPYDAVLLICGCDHACIENEMPSDAPLVSLKDPGVAPEEVIASLLRKGK